MSSEHGSGEAGGTPGDEPSPLLHRYQTLIGFLLTVKYLQLSWSGR